MSNLSPIQALILVGGKSSRLGREKAMIDYHGEPQVAYLYHQLETLGFNTSVSCNKKQAIFFKDQFPLIVDGYDAIGPIGGILTAFNACLEHDWLVLACDMPNIRKADITFLCEQHKPALITTYKSISKPFPETTFTIYPKSVYEKLKLAVDRKQYRLQNILNNTALNLVTPQNTEVLFNVNDKEDLSKVENRNRDKEP